MSIDRNDVCDYVIARLAAAVENPTELKLQKLMYYIQAWHLAFYNEPLFQGRFQAWVHGPVNRQLYDRFGASKSLYSQITMDDVATNFDADKIPRDKRDHIDAVLEEYAKYTGSQLEQMTHSELPWIEARRGYQSTQRCEVEINESMMGRYYRKRVENGEEE